MNDLVLMRPVGKHFVFKGTTQELDEMEEIWNQENRNHPNFKKYFHYVVPNNNTGAYFIPRHEYFKAYDGNTSWNAMFKKHTGISAFEYFCPTGQAYGIM